MERLLLSIRYNGTPFYGWQSQIESQPSVQSTIRHVLSQLYDKPITVIGASRTDRFVHARDQIASITVPRGRFELDTLLKSLNKMLKPHIYVNWIRRVNRDYKLTQHIRSKVYHYYCYHDTKYAPFLQDYASWAPKSVLYSAALKSYCAVFEGTHDFKNFANVGTPMRSTVRTLYGVSLRHWRHLSIFRFHGNGFLKQMVRNLVGTLLSAAHKDISASMLYTYLTSDKRVPDIITAPAQGLVLFRTRL